MRFARIALGVAAGLMLWGGVAYADSLDFGAPTVTPVGSDFQWQYPISIDAAQHINTAQNGAFITLYDVGGLVGTPTYTAPGPLLGGTVSVQNTGFTPLTQNPTDNPSVPNISIDFLGTAASSTSVGTLSFLDTQSGANVETSDFSAQATLNVSNAVAANTSSIPVPAPEPGSLALMGSGLAGLLAFARRIRG